MRGPKERLVVTYDMKTLAACRMATGRYESAVLQGTADCIASSFRALLKMWCAMPIASARLPAGYQATGQALITTANFANCRCIKLYTITARCETDGTSSEPFGMLLQSTSRRI